MDNYPGFGSEYSYLIWTLLLLALFLGLVFLSSKHSRSALLFSALLSTPAAFASVYFVPEYWKPVRVAEFLAGPEDLMFSFATGGFAWFFATLGRNQPKLNFQWGRIVLRYVILLSVWQISFWAADALIHNVMYAAIIAISASGIFLLACGKQTLGPLIMGCLIFVSFYQVFATVVFHLDPEFLSQWNSDKLWGVYIFGVPFEESVWAAVFGFVWPMAFRFMIDDRQGIFGRSRGNFGS